MDDFEEIEVSVEEMVEITWKLELEAESCHGWILQSCSKL